MSKPHRPIINCQSDVSQPACCHDCCALRIYKLRLLNVALTVLLGIHSVEGGILVFRGDPGGEKCTLVLYTLYITKLVCETILCAFMMLVHIMAMSIVITNV